MAVTEQEILDDIENDINQQTTPESILKVKVVSILNKIIALIGINKALLSNVDNTSDINKPVSTAQQSELNLKANIESPALTGSPTAPTQSQGDNSTKLATTEYVDTAVGAGGDTPSYQDVLSQNNTSNVDAIHTFGTAVGTYGAAFSTESTSSLDKTDVQPAKLIFSKNNSGLKSLTLRPNQAPTANRTQTYQDKNGNVGIQEYKQYVCKISQTGTGDPLKTVIGNNDIGNISFFRTDVGVYTGNLNSAFTSNTFLPKINVYSPDGRRAEIQVVDVDNVQILTFDAAGDLSDDILSNAFLEIRVYNI